LFVVASEKNGCAGGGTTKIRRMLWKKKNRGGGGGGKIGPFKSSFFMPLVKITKRVNFLLCFYLFRNYSLYLSQSKFLN
jgi:hypothetical protein